MKKPQAPKIKWAAIKTPAQLKAAELRVEKHKEQMAKYYAQQAFKAGLAEKKADLKQELADVRAGVVKGKKGTTAKRKAA